jgi:predicted dehydrogenase
LRYRSDFNRVKSLVDQGAIGEIKSIEHREGIDPVRFSHNYVRGKWAREEDNTFLLLHKSSHDLDFIAWLVDRPCQRVSSFGGRSFFHPGHAPEHAGTRCLVDCPIEDTCFFSARRIYLSKPPDQWPARDVVTSESAKDLEGELAKGPFGRCVWRHSNDVVDHQMVNLEFDRGCYAQFSLVGLSHKDGRYTHIFGTEGNLIFDEAAQHIMLSRFGATPEEISLQNPGGYHPEDRLIAQGWLNAIHSGDLSGLMVDPEEALRTHTLAFAAERSRKQNRIVDITEFD